MQVIIRNRETVDFNGKQPRQELQPIFDPLLPVFVSFAQNDPFTAELVELRFFSAVSNAESSATRWL